MRIRIMALAATAAVACAKKEEAKKSEASEENIAETKVGDVAINEFAQVSLAESVSPLVPESVSATGSGVETSSAGTVSIAYLADTKKKSMEACYIRQQIRLAKMDVDSMAMNLCMVQSQPGLKVGGKYKISFKDMAGGGGAPAGGDPTTGGAPPGSDPTAGMGSGDPTAGMGSGPLPLALQGDEPMPDPNLDPDLQGDPTLDPDLQGDPTKDPDLQGDQTTNSDGQTAGTTGDQQMPGATDGPGSDMAMPDMPESMSIYLDNSVAGKLTVFICVDDKLSDKLVLHGVGTDGGAKGAFKRKMTMDGFDAQLQGYFDNGVGAAGRSRISVESSFAASMGQDKKYNRTRMDMDLSKDQISVIKVAGESSGTMGDFSNAQKEIGAALIGPNLGSALFQRSGTATGQAQPLTDADFSTARTYFDNAGNALTAEASTSFAENGTLYVKQDMLPKLLADAFKVEFEPGDWDCTGTTDIKLEENEKFNACNSKFESPFSEEDCMGAMFAAGPPVTDAPPLFDERSGPVDPSTVENPETVFGPPPPLPPAP